MLLEAEIPVKLTTIPPEKLVDGKILLPFPDDVMEFLTDDEKDLYYIGLYGYGAEQSLQVLIYAARKGIAITGGRRISQILFQTDAKTNELLFNTDDTGLPLIFFVAETDPSIPAVESVENFPEYDEAFAIDLPPELRLSNLTPAGGSF